MKHTAIVKIPKSEQDRVNRLLDIPYVSEVTDEDLKKLIDSYAYGVCFAENIISVKFDDGSVLNYDLCYGSDNFYDDVWWESADGQHDISLECTFDLSDIEFDVDGETYEVNILTTEI